MWNDDKEYTGADIQQGFHIIIIISVYTLSMVQTCLSKAPLSSDALCCSVQTTGQHNNYNIYVCVCVCGGHHVHIPTYPEQTATLFQLNHQRSWWWVALCKPHTWCHCTFTPKQTTTHRANQNIPPRRILYIDVYQKVVTTETTRTYGE